MKILNPHDPLVSVTLAALKRAFEDSLEALGKVDYNAPHHIRQEAIARKDRNEKKYWDFKARIR